MQVRYLAALRPDGCRLAQRQPRDKVRMAPGCVYKGTGAMLRMGHLDGRIHGDGPLCLPAKRAGDPLIR